MFLGAARTAFTAGATTGGYKVTAASSVSIVDQTTSAGALLDANYFTSSQELYAANDASLRVPYLTGSQAWGSSLYQLVIDSWIYLPSSLFTGTDSGIAYIYARSDTQPFTGGSLAPSNIHLMINKVSSSSKVTDYWESESGSTSDAIVYFELAYITSLGFYGTKLVGFNTSDSAYSGWNRLQIGLVTDFDAGSSIGSTSLTSNPLYGYSGYNGRLFSMVTNHATNTRRIKEEGLFNDSGVTLDFDDTNSDEHYVGFMDGDYATAHTDIEVGPLWLYGPGSAFNWSQWTANDTAIYTGFADHNTSNWYASEFVRLDWAGTTDVARLTNRNGSNVYDDDATGTLTMGTFQ